MTSVTPLNWKEIGTAESTVPAQYSDDALAQVFTNCYGKDLRYTAVMGRWRIWNGTIWKTDDTRRVLDLVREVCRKEAASCKDERLGRHVSSTRTVMAVERLAQADRRHAATVEQWDADPWILNTPSGVIDLKTGMIRPALREDYCTKTTAVAPSGNFPLWPTFLGRITNSNRELQSYLQRIVGYALTGITSEHAMWFAYGTGANGKSVFLNTISGVMGDYSRVAPVETFTDTKNQSHPTDVAGLQGARFVSAIETEEGRRWAESKVKALTGGDRITARFMRQDFFEYKPQFKLFVAGNHKPGLRAPDEAMRRRLNLLPFDVTIPAEERDPELEQKLKAEWSGILRWAIEGCLAWQRDGLNSPEIVNRATSDYFVEEDSLARWLEDRTERRDGAWESASDLFSDWKNWAESAGEFVGTQKRFSVNLTTRGYSPTRKKHGRGFNRISLRRGSVTDGDGSTDYPSHARGKGNSTTRHHPSPLNGKQVHAHTAGLDSLVIPTPPLPNGKTDKAPLTATTGEL
jgi:putative DNA primase/helicase